jgi:hypothetical protein
MLGRDLEDLEEKLEPKRVLDGGVGGTEKDVEPATVMSLRMLRERSTINCMTAIVRVKVRAQLMRQSRTSTHE